MCNAVTVLHMHPTLYIPELLVNIFSHCTNADLAVLARTCKAFKEAALDLLWEELDDLSPLVRCAPDACRRIPRNYTSFRQPEYCFSRSLSKAEQDTLRSYSRRIRTLYTPEIYGFITECATRMIFNLEPLTEPIFPNLRSLYWECMEGLCARRVAVPSLTRLYFLLPSFNPNSSLESLDVFADYCPYLKVLVVRSPRVGDVRISHQICRWPNLCEVDCLQVILTKDAIAHLSSAPNLKWLSFMAEMDEIQRVVHDHSKWVFSSLTVLFVTSRSMDTIALLLSHLHLPRLKELTIYFSNDVSRGVIKACWAAALEACPLVLSIHLQLRTRRQGPTPGEEQLTLEDLHPCTAFSELRVLHINVGWRVHLSDADLLHLASPRMERMIINYEPGWSPRTRGEGITLGGLVRLLRQCPSLNQLHVAFDASTFTEVPEELDVSFPPRKGLLIGFADAYIPPEFALDVVSAFKAFGLDASVSTRNGEMKMLLEADNAAGTPSV